nr:ATP-binding cassette domain-containing protein [Streptomyces sp. Ag109_O5-1]
MPRRVSGSAAATRCSSTPSGCPRTTTRTIPGATCRPGSPGTSTRRSTWSPPARYSCSTPPSACSSSPAPRCGCAGSWPCSPSPRRRCCGWARAGCPGRSGRCRARSATGTGNWSTRSTRTSRTCPSYRRPGAVTPDNVGFTYPGGNRPIVTGLGFTAYPGQLVLIDGPSGSGKSTLAKLLLRFYDPTEGRILLDGRDITSLPLRRLRELITLVPQDPMLLDATIRENIAYGRPGADERSVLRAAEAADVAGFAHRMPDGYDTAVGPGGRQLSGGQQRRVAIARAPVRDTPVLVLDEPTTGLDAESARRVMEPLRRLMASRTTFLITHDPQLAVQADTVLPVGPLPELLDVPPSGGRAKVV